MTTLPDYLSDQTDQTILKRMLKLVPDDLDKSEGSYIWDSLNPASIQFSLAAIWAQEVLRRSFASTTFGPYLDMRCEERGVFRRPAAKATGKVKFIGTVGTLIPAGTQVATEADPITNTPSILYLTVGAVTLDSKGEATADISAIEAGKHGNVPAGAISLMITPVPGVTSVKNTSEITGGNDIESDASLLERFLIQTRNPGTSGNKANYMKWALEVAGVGGVQVHPLWAGPGTVRVVLLDTEKRAAGPAIVEAVQKYIDPVPSMGEGQAPIGATVTVAAAEEVPINVSVKLTIATGSNLFEVRNLIQTGLNNYLRNLAFVDPLVRYTRVAAILLDIPPIIDFSDLKVNGISDENIEMKLGQVAVPGTVTVYE